MRCMLAESHNSDCLGYLFFFFFFAFLRLDKILKAMEMFNIDGSLYLWGRAAECQEMVGCLCAGGIFRTTEQALNIELKQSGTFSISKKKKNCRVFNLEGKSLCDFIV